MTISVLFLAGRFLLAVPFVLPGVARLTSAEASPGERAWGAVGVVGAAGVVLGVFGDVAALVLAVQVAGSAFTADRSQDPDATVRAVGLVGAAVVAAALYIAVGAALDLTITDPVLDLDLR